MRAGAECDQSTSLYEVVEESIKKVKKEKPKADDIIWR